ncbi:MAG: hypothetical protein O7B25_05060 [Gammaproteobacteria bacterium]|nr:hypothetical protein [Gammaproteobacteria bacterium]
MTLADLFNQLRSANPQMRVVAHRPLWRLFMLGLLALVALGGSIGGFYFGTATARLDVTYLNALMELDRANNEQISNLKSQLVDAELARQVDGQAGGRLRQDIKELRDEAAELEEEVTFYKSLMAPSSIERGLQIAEFELLSTKVVDQFSYHLLLTQTEQRRDWIQGDVTLEVRGRRRRPDLPKDEELVLSLTEIADIEPYPLKFRFRYFQDLSGLLTLPSGFMPEKVDITALRRGSRSDSLRRTFEWVVRDDA